MGRYQEWLEQQELDRKQRETARKAVATRFANREKAEAKRSALAAQERNRIEAEAEKNPPGVSVPIQCGCNERRVCNACEMGLL